MTRRLSISFCLMVLAGMVTADAGPETDKGFVVVNAFRSDLSNSLTARSKIPHGCLIYNPGAVNIPHEARLFFDGIIRSDSSFGTTELRVRGWREGCHEPDRSIILFDFEQVGPFVGEVSPRFPTEVFLETSDGTRYSARMLSGPSNNERNPGWEGRRELPNYRPERSGFTFMIDSVDTDLTVEQYNGEIEVRFEEIELDFDWLVPLIVEVPAYDPGSLPPRFTRPALHGRYSGQWVSPDLPRSGLSLQVGETDQNRNYVFVIWFTYLDGEPIWVVGNTDLLIGSDRVELEMLRLEGGGFVTSPGTFDSSDIDTESIGTMTLRALHCNAIEAEMDFTAAGLGSQTLILDRLIRIAGYDCDQTQ